jgi:hypothetical protein
MEIFITILLIIVGLIGLLLLVALFAPKGYSVERQIVIRQPRMKVFDYLRYLKNQDYYNKWVMTDPTARKEFIGIDGEEGFIYKWDSDNKQMGKGEQETTKLTTGRRIDLEMRFIKPFKNTAPAFLETDEIDADQTKVTWGFRGRMPYPFNAMMLVINFKQLLGNDLQISLENLKTLLEKK